MVKNLKEVSSKTSTVDYGFSILKAVAQGSHTKWSIMYDITEKKIHFFTLDNKQKKTVSFSAFDFVCTNQTAFDMNQVAQGDISKKFEKLTFENNKILIEKSAMESRSAIEIKEEEIKKVVLFFNKTKCR